MNERRKCFRWQINRQAKVKLEGAQDFANCHIKDINLKGLQISLGLKLPKDTFLRLTLFLAEEFTLDVEAWVVWHKTIMEINTYGLYLTKVKDQDKESIYKFVHRHYPEQIKRQYWQGLEEEKGGEIMQKARFEDRRIFARFSANFPLRFLDLRSGKEGEASTQDIGAKGIGFVTKEQLQPDTLLEMWLQVPDKGEPLYARGGVVWSEMVEPNKYRVGVNLEKANLMGMSRVLRTI